MYTFRTYRVVQLTSDSTCRTMRTRGAMWDKWERMELQESDPNRFDNRGGKLLKEEKERKRIARELPKYEDTIIKEIASWEQDTGKNFTVMGRTFSDYVNHQKEEVCYFLIPYIIRPKPLSTI